MSHDSKETENFAAALAKKLRGGEVIELVGDVGAGKTTFVRGLAEGIDSADKASSPTFTLEQIYKGRITLHHFDLYRLAEAGLVGNELEEALEDEEAGVVIEWADSVSDILPKERMVIRFEVTSENERKLHITNPYEYVELN